MCPVPDDPQLTLGWCRDHPTIPPGRIPLGLGARDTGISVYAAPASALHSTSRLAQCSGYAYHPDQRSRKLSTRLSSEGSSTTVVNTTHSTMLAMRESISGGLCKCSLWQTDRQADRQTGCPPRQSLLSFSFDSSIGLLLLFVACLINRSFVYSPR
ncbi:hypothetical protein F5Y07DRAFT_153477 [Xylaria sp. FL0933]|nr:hypothetical protein F5Y07DRAFT_153477 [Xylaria sp. FL0933]